MPKRLKYELIDNATGRTLVSGSSSAEVLSKAAQYMRDYNLSYDEVSYVVITNGAKAEAAFTTSGNELKELIEDEVEEDEYEEDSDEWTYEME